MDSIVTSVIEQFKARSEFGEKKYGVNMDRDDLSFKEWVTHMKEELMDAILYLEKLEKLYGQEAPNTQGDTK
tara:strand:- start:340 stop:555 length:216 start_codon:yes stop_codon:yes gene_type:complete